MHFLCPTHRRQLLELPSHKQTDIWLQWLNDAAMYYELGLWREVVAYTGCAFDLCYHSLTLRGGEDCATRLTLSAIYLANALQHKGENEKADTMLSVAFRLLQHLQARQGQAIVSDCMLILLDGNAHGAFFNRYLNLPFVLARRVCH